MEYIISLICIVIIALYALRKKLKGVYCKVDRDMTGEVVVITGSNSGIGLETAKELAKRNATIIMGCRDMKKGKEGKEEILQYTNNKANVHLIQLDLSDLKDVYKFVEAVENITPFITILINNAGVFGILNKQYTKQQYEMIFGTNYIGHFYLTQLLIPLFDKERQNRILNIVTYVLNNNLIDYSLFDKNTKYNHIQSYVGSKLFLVNHALALNLLYQNSLNLKAVSIHPGVIDTNIVNNLQASSKILNYLLKTKLKDIYAYFIKTPIQGAQSTLHCCLEDFDSLQGGDYFYECKSKKINDNQLNEKQALEIYQFTQKQIQNLSI